MAWNRVLGTFLERETSHPMGICLCAMPTQPVPVPEGHGDARDWIPLLIQDCDLALVDVYDLAELYQSVGVWFGCHMMLDGPKKVLEPL